LRTLLVKPSQKIVLSPAELRSDSAALTVELLDVSGHRGTRTVGPPRASSIYEACMRMHVICTLEPIVVPDNFDFARRLTFDIGEAIHHRIQNSPTLLGDMRRGYWKCRACGRVTLFGKPPVTRCPKCDADSGAFVYWEYSIQMRKPYFFSGHPDMFVEKGDRIRILEIKTMDGDKYAKLVAPLISHLWQVNGYMWACHELAFEIGVEIDDSHSYIMYVSKKETRKELPFKTFFVKRDPYIIQDLLKKLDSYKKGVTGGPMPEPLHACISSEFRSAPATYCPIRGLCSDMWRHP
jgi:hypothetical protein